MTETQGLRYRIVTYVYDGFKNGSSPEDIETALRLLGYTKFVDRRSILALRNRRIQGVRVKELIDGYWTNAARFKR